MNATKRSFIVGPTSIKDYSLIQWDYYGFPPLPRRSLQVETEIARLWAAAPAMLEALKRFTATWADGMGFCVHCGGIDGDDLLRPHLEDCPIPQARAVLAKLEED